MHGTPPMSMTDLPRNLWYPLFLSSELGNQPRKFERFGEVWVGCRLSDGRLLMAADRCPHLGASLSQGEVINDQIQCPFHGFCYDEKGHCTAAPALGAKHKVPEKLRVKTIPLREIQGWIWGWWGDIPTTLPNVPTFTEIDHHWRWGDITSDWSVHVTRAIENQLDVAHLPFVHRRSIGAGNRTQVEGPYVEADGDAIRVWVTNRQDTGESPRSLEDLAVQAQNRPPNLEFRFPGLWQLRIHDKLRLLVGFVPVNAGTTRFYVRACHQVRVPLIGRVYSALLGIGNRWILREDQRIVSHIVPQSSMDAHDDLLMASDRAIVRFRKRWRQMLDISPPDNDASP